MAIPVARVHLAMGHAALPGLLPTPPKCTMLPLLPTPPCAAIVLPISPPRPSRGDAAERWDAHKCKEAGGSSSPSSSSSSLGRRASSSEKWVSNRKKKSAGASTSSSWSSSSSNSYGRADSGERWDAHKKPAASPASSSLSSCSSSSSMNKRRVQSSKRINNSRTSSLSAVRWDARKSGGRRAARGDELDDGASSTGSNDMELVMVPAAVAQRELYAGPGFLAPPEPSMLPMPWSLIRVA